MVLDNNTGISPNQSQSPTRLDCYSDAHESNLLPLTFDNDTRHSCEVDATPAWSAYTLLSRRPRQGTSRSNASSSADNASEHYAYEDACDTYTWTSDASWPAEPQICNYSPTPHSHENPNVAGNYSYSTCGLYTPLCHPQITALPDWSAIPPLVGSSRVDGTKVTSNDDPERLFYDDLLADEVIPLTKTKSRLLT